MTASVHNVTFDAKEPRKLGRFWSAVTGYTVTEERDDFVRLRTPDGHGIQHILFFLVHDPTPGKNRVHMDLTAEKPEEEIERLLGLGATLVDEPHQGKPRWREGNDKKWVVLRDLEGNEFCIR